MQFSIPTPKSYDLLDSVHSWIYPEIQPVPERTGDTWFARSITVENIQLPVLIFQECKGARLNVHINNSDISVNSIILKVRQILSLDYDIKPALEIMKQDSILNPIASKLSGIRPYLSDTLFEALIKSIAQQQISYKTANVLIKRLIESEVTPNYISEREIFGFPGTKCFLRLGEVGLRKFGFGYKSRYIVDICNMIHLGNLNLSCLLGVSSEQVMKELTPIRGIGEWTVRALQIAGLGDFSVFPFGDLGIQNLLGRMYNNGIRVSKQDVIDYCENWGEHGPMVLYLLMCADVLGYLGEHSR